jgi:hypothetical protein
MTDTRIHFALGFGKDQKPLIVYILHEMIAANIDIEFAVEDFEERCMFYLNFPDAASIYAFGHKQGLLSSDPGKIMEIISKDLAKKING